MAKEVLELEVKSNIGDVSKDTNSLAKESNKASTGVAGIGTAFAYVGRAIKAAGIGLVVALLAKLMQVFSQNQKVLDTFNTAMTALSIAFNDFFGFIENNIGTITGYFKELFEDPIVKIEELGRAITEGLYNRFIELLDVVGFVGKALVQLVIGDFSGALDSIKQAGEETIDIFTGVDESLGTVVETITAYTTETYKQAKALTDVSNAALLAEVQFAKLNAEYLREAEIQRQVRDDVSKTFAVRIAANKELSEVLARQAEDQKKQVQIQIDAAQAQFDVNDSVVNRIALGQAENAMLELKETITGQISEQLTNQTALEEELRVGREQSLAEGSSGLERELEELRLAYEEKKRLADKSGVDTVAITKQYEKQKTDLVQANVNEQLEAFSGLAGALSALAGDNKALAIASAVIDTYVGANKAFAQGGVAGFATGAAVIAAGLNNVRTIMATDVPSSGGGGGSVAAPSTPAPQMMSGAFDISGGVAPEATKAYVVTDEMSNSQNQLANIRRRATI